MKITAVRVRQVRGTMPTEGPFWEERLVRPVDVYPEFRKEQHLAEYGRQIDDRSLEVEAFFLTIETDDGVSGIAGPFREPCAHFVATQLRPVLLGKDPLATRISVGRDAPPPGARPPGRGDVRDQRGRLRALGPQGQVAGPAGLAGPGRADPDGDPGLCQHAGLRRARSRPGARARARGQGAGLPRAEVVLPPRADERRPRGCKKNVELVRTLRETLGDDDEIMLDCWQSFDYRYLLELAARIEEFRPYWLEEAAMPDRIDTYRRFKDKTKIPLAGAEHDYTRWGMKRFIEQDALDVYQPDPYWCGGLSETLKIAALTTTHDLICIPHGHSTPVNADLHGAAVADPHALAGISWSSGTRCTSSGSSSRSSPQSGVIRLPEFPGLCPPLDESKVEASAGALSRAASIASG